MSDIVDFLARGGWLMVPIAVASVVALAFFIERLWNLQRAKVLPDRFLEIISKLLEERRFEKAEALCQGNDSHVAAVLEAGIRYHGRSRETIKAVLEEAGQREVHFMERFTGVLGAVATVAPLLGLLGTVTGMISVFQRVVNQAAAGQAADAGALANGIWEALITTAAGLTVAIPAYLAYRYIVGLIDRYAVELADVGLKAMEYLVSAEEAPTMAPANLRAGKPGAEATTEPSGAAPEAT